MFLLILALILFIHLALLPGLIHVIFSTDELCAMGIHLENSHS
jgi:hypothetical protein